MDWSFLYGTEFLAAVTVEVELTYPLASRWQGLSFSLEKNARCTGRRFSRMRMVMLRVTPEIGKKRALRVMGGSAMAVCFHHHPCLLFDLWPPRSSGLIDASVLPTFGMDRR